jgi:hypothetical protein
MKAPNMEKVIEEIFETIQDYRLDDIAAAKMSKDRIAQWINQFDESVRLPILVELNQIFKIRYISKTKAKHFLQLVITKLSEDFGFENELEFLENVTFLDLQPNGKSQKILLGLLDKLLEEKYGIRLSDCGKKSTKYSIYIDDILCTGLTLISDIVKWSKQQFLNGKTNKMAVEDNSTKLIFTYIFIHNKNYNKKKAEMRYKISGSFADHHKMYRLIAVENQMDHSAKLNLVLPSELTVSEPIAAYRNKIIEEVDSYTQRYNNTSPEEFYRNADLPVNEEFYSSPGNRDIMEKAFLEKGIEILANTNVINRNMRALGYTLPSLKNFGFGALCFTWRNVPNNAPLVFWYSNGDFIPLFKVSRGNADFIL